MVDRRLIIRGWIVLLAACPVAAAAFDFRDLTNQFAHPPAHSERQGISLDEAVARVRRQTDGKILSAETVRVDGRQVHRIKVLTPNGRVTRMDIDADTGRPASRGR
jgi:uncharacterized membrane protein YkoI